MNLKRLILTMIPLSLAKTAFIKYPSILFAYIIKGKTKQLILSNPEKVLSIIRRGEYIVVNKSGNQYGSLNMCYINDMLGGALLALGLGYLPYYQIPYYEEIENEQTMIHDEFFKQVLCNERKKGISIKAGGGLSYPYIYDEKEIRIYSFLYKNLFFLNEKTKRYVENTYNEVRCKVKGKILGVCCRGTDFISLRPKGHPVQPTVDQVLEKVQQYIAQYGYDKIYVTSEEYKIVKIFEEAYPEKVLTNKKMYYDELFYSNDQVTYIGQVEFDRENDRYLRGIEYFSSVYILSKCNAIIGGNCGATRAALYMNDLNYEEKYIFDLGLY